jgi:hypothetical protein
MWSIVLPDNSHTQLPTAQFSAAAQLNEPTTFYSTRPANSLWGDCFTHGASACFLGLNDNAWLVRLMNLTKPSFSEQFNYDEINERSSSGHGIRWKHPHGEGSVQGTGLTRGTIRSNGPTLIIVTLVERELKSDHLLVRAAVELAAKLPHDMLCVALCVPNDLLAPDEKGPHDGTQAAPPRCDMTTLIAGLLEPYASGLCQAFAAPGTSLLLILNMLL